MNTLYDVLAVSIATRTVRLIAKKKGQRGAAAVVTMAIVRRKVNNEFFVEVSSGSYQEGERWVGQKETP